MEDLKEGGDCFVGVCGNVLKVIGWEMQELVDDETDTIVYVLAFRQLPLTLTDMQQLPILLRQICYYCC